MLVGFRDIVWKKRTAVRTLPPRRPSAWTINARRLVIRLQFHTGERTHRGLSDRAQQRVVLFDVRVQRHRTTASQLRMLVHARRTHQPRQRQPTPRSAPETSRRPDGNSTLQEEQ